eukprot:CAMPEP_0115150916 /NCGR_PEP_ID=MMETSP0227-20121206/65308_1 /TAXON_ID=89957 /ORGANISM="Polarella glacialis, Strain CCMP 1383" /LENGTH=165 /DNA_ID=CAMNT_0002561341 /DNA_START=87 /DNA_END=584 /DNA_ORIENTATION=-
MTGGTTFRGPAKQSSGYRWFKMEILFINNCLLLLYFLKGRSGREASSPHGGAQTLSDRNKLICVPALSEPSANKSSSDSSSESHSIIIRANCVTLRNSASERQLTRVGGPSVAVLFCNAWEEKSGDGTAVFMPLTASSVCFSHARAGEKESGQLSRIDIALLSKS